VMPFLCRMLRVDGWMGKELRGGLPAASGLSAAATAADEDDEEEEEDEDEGVEGTVEREAEDEEEEEEVLCFLIKAADGEAGRLEATVSSPALRFLEEEVEEDAPLL
jgi:hypothetical protein